MISDPRELPLGYWHLYWYREWRWILVCLYIYICIFSFYLFIILLLFIYYERESWKMTWSMISDPRLLSFGFWLLSFIDTESGKGFSVVYFHFIYLFSYLSIFLFIYNIFGMRVKCGQYYFLKITSIYIYKHFLIFI